MKIAKLPNGAELRFPEKTSDEVIKKTVKRVLGVEEGPKLEEVLEQLGTSLSNKDYFGPALKENTKAVKDSSKQLSSAISKLDKKQVDNFGPALKQHGGVLDKVIMTFAGIFAKNSQENRKLNEISAKELAKRLAVLSNNVELLTLKMDKNVLLLVKAHDQNTQAVRELVKAYKSPRTVIRDNDGKIERIN